MLVVIEYTESGGIASLRSCDKDEIRGEDFLVSLSKLLSNTLVGE